MTTIGIVGLGKMGRPVGRHLIANGYAVVGHDPDAAAAAEATALGIATLASPAETAARSDLVMVLAGFDEEVERAVFGQDGIVSGARDGLVLAIGSTIAPGYAEDMARRLEGRAIGLLDVPSTRGQRALEKGEVLILGGGDADLFAAWRPMLACFAAEVFHFGPFGAGQVAKMANNMILWACTAANDEAMRLAESLGVDPETLRQALGISSAQNWALSTRAEERPMPWAEKDMTIVLREADRMRMSLPVAGTIKEAIKGYKIRRGIPAPVARRD